jgi:hypothetical protein
VLARVRGDLTWPLAAYAGFLTIYPLLAAGSPRVAGLALVMSWFCLSWWLWDDARRMKFVLPMGYGMTMFLILPLFLPLYLWETRGALAVVTLMLYFLIIVVGAQAGEAVALWRMGY